MDIKSTFDDDNERGKNIKSKNTMSKNETQTFFPSQHNKTEFHCNNAGSLKNE